MVFQVRRLCIIEPRQWQWQRLSLRVVADYTDNAYVIIPALLTLDVRKTEEFLRHIEHWSFAPIVVSSEIAYSLNARFPCREYTIHPKEYILRLSHGSGVTFRAYVYSEDFVDFQR